MRAPGWPRAFAAVALLSLCGAAAPQRAGAQETGPWTGDPVVRTGSGLVRGFADDDETWSWKGVPYAAPPVGDLRWRAPRPPVPWAGVRDARRFAGACTQYVPLVGGITGSEDCLSLNVWRPRTAERGLPVYVWIHGGGNSIGSASMVNEYRGNRLARRSNMVFVSLNYRLGPFGWFTHPALREGLSPADDSGNYGTLDIIEALRWIRENIAAFGGDPGLVAVTGESAGGLNVLSLLVAPAAEGLFHRAIAQSPPARTVEPAAGDARAQAVLERLAGRAAAAMTPAQARAFLRSKSDRAILRCYAFSGFGMVDNPALFRDGAVIPAGGLEALSTSRSAGEVPLLVGSNRDELKLFLAFGGKPAWNTPLGAAVARYGTMRWRAGGVDAVARRIATRPDAARPGGPRVWAYEFAWGAADASGASTMPGSWGRRLGAFHSLEIPFFLGHETVDAALHHAVFTSANRQGRRALTAAMMDYAAAFVRTGDPNRPGSGLPRWEPWSPGESGPKGIVLDADLREARIARGAEELTDEGVFAAMDRELPPDLAARTRAHLSQRGWPSGSR